MTQEFIKKLVCILTRDGIELWVEKERTNSLRETLRLTTGSKFVDIDGEIVNTSDIVGIFSARVMEDTTRRKNGQWKDKQGNWHDKGTRVCPNHPNVILQFGKACGYCL